ncbi:MAG: hypothetical protein Q8R31_04155 [Candidatus Omnitrophota bacterium]|nr:hypothetical protein [Candidatus Omnitrophota bacterium]
MKIIKRYCSIVLLFYCSIVLLGCAIPWEGAKGFAGVSTRALEDNRKTAVTKAFNYDYLTCYAKSVDILKRMQVYIYTQSIKKHMIAIYVSKQDITPVGLFFKEIDANNTQVEVSSLSTYAKEFISGKVFPVLDKQVTLEELEAKIHAQEKTGDK